MHQHLIMKVLGWVQNTTQITIVGGCDSGILSWGSDGQLCVLLAGACAWWKATRACARRVWPTLPGLGPAPTSLVHGVAITANVRTLSMIYMEGVGVWAVAGKGRAVVHVCG